MAFLFWLFILAPLTVILTLVGWLTGNKIFGKILGYFWLLHITAPTSHGG
jgi:hypothetical protein